MSESYTYNASDFFISTAVQTGAATVLLAFTQNPLQVSSGGVHDGLNLSNYTVTGPAVNPISAIVIDPVNHAALQIQFGAPLIAGTWTITVSNQVQTPGGRALQAPYSISFAAVLITSDDINGGATNDTPATVIRKHMSSAMKGPTWTSLIAAAASSDQDEWDNAAAAFDQLFRCTASGIYLDRKLGDDGIRRPAGVGMVDADFAAYGIRVNASKLTQRAVNRVLEVFYGVDSVRAYAQSLLTEPFGLVSGQTLTVLVDERQSVNITFQAADFSQQGIVSANEVAAAITRALEVSGTSAYAVSSADITTGLNHVRIYSGTLGLYSAIRVTFGTAQTALQFPSILPIPSIGTTPSTLIWSVAIGPQIGSARMTMTGGFPLSSGLGLDLTQVQVGDYVCVSGGGFSAPNRGCFRVTNVVLDYITPAYYIDVANPIAYGQSGVVETSLSDVLFGRGLKQTTQTNNVRPMIVTQANTQNAEVLLPTTTVIVHRGPDTGAYVSEQEEYAVPTMVQTGNRVSFSLGEGLPLPEDAWNPATDLPFAHGAVTYPYQMQAFIDGAVGSGLNGPQTVTMTSDTAGTFTSSKSCTTSSAQGANVVLIPSAALPATETGVVGPYIYDPKTGLGGITSVQTTLTTPVYEGQQMGSLAVGSTAGFSATGGYLALSAGFENQVAPLQYLGVIDATHLSIDFRFVFPKSVVAGSTVVALAQKGPWVPEAPETVGSFYLTDSNSGRVAASSIVADIVGTGLNIFQGVLYPGDWGLAGAGRPSHGVPKLSDEVIVWGSNTPDEDYRNAEVS